MRGSRRSRLGRLVAASLFLPLELGASWRSGVAAPLGGPVYCAFGDPGEGAGKSAPYFPNSARVRVGLPRPPATFGPCASADGVGVLPPSGGFPAVFLTNFGLLFREAAVDAGPSDAADAGADAADAGQGRPRYGLVCEESFGGKVPERVVRHPDGRLFVVGTDGLHVAADGCGYARAAGSIAWKDVAEVAFDPRDPARGYALTRAPAALHTSSDGGRTFTLATTFAPELRLERLFVAAPAASAAPVFIYLTGSTAQHPLALVRSEDGGASFATDLHGPALFARPGVLTVVAGPAPAQPTTLFLTAGSGVDADEIWRSTDAGRSWARVLTLLGTESRAGFTYGATATEVFVAGIALIPRAGTPPGHLYVSHDGGASFTPKPSGPRGPRYRCLAAAEGRLFACGDPRDDFFFGASDDEGTTWLPLATLADIEGPLPCTEGRCLGTAIWLCQSYGICAPDLPNNLPEQPDGGSADVGGVDGEVDAGAPHPDSGCSCRLGARSSGFAERRQGPRGWLVPLALLLVPVVRATRARRRCRRRSS